MCPLCWHQCCGVRVKAVELESEGIWFCWSGVSKSILSFKSTTLEKKSYKAWASQPESDTQKIKESESDVLSTDSSALVGTVSRHFFILWWRCVGVEVNKWTEIITFLKVEYNYNIDFNDVIEWNLLKDTHNLHINAHHYNQQYMPVYRIVARYHLQDDTFWKLWHCLLWLTVHWQHKA